MSNRPVGDNKSGIFTLFFREAGLFWEQAFQWSQQQTQQAVQWAEQQSKEDRLLLADDDRRRLTDAETRQREAEARLLEQVRLAKEAGLDVDAILKRVRK